MERTRFYCAISGEGGGTSAGKLIERFTDRKVPTSLPILVPMDNSTDRFQACPNIRTTFFPFHKQVCSGS